MSMIRNLAAAAVACLTLGVADAAAEPFTLFIFEEPARIALRGDETAAGAAYWNSWGAAGRAMMDAGIVRGGSALSTAAAVGRVGGESAKAVDVGLSGSALVLGGYFQIDVADDATALDWAARLPVGYGMVEVRAGYPVPADM